jgi:hypothetical protein
LGMRLIGCKRRKKLENTKQAESLNTICRSQPNLWRKGGAWYSSLARL